MARKSGAIIKSRNKQKQYDDNPSEVQCPICKRRFKPNCDNIEIVGSTYTYWCECGEQFIQGMKCIEYKYS